MDLALHSYHKIIIIIIIIITNYYMARSLKDWELPIFISRIWLAEMDIDCSLDFPI